MTYNIRNVRGENIAKLLVIWILDINWFYDERPSGLPTSWFTKNNICLQFLLIAIVRKSKCILQFKKNGKKLNLLPTAWVEEEKINVKALGSWDVTA